MTSADLDAFERLGEAYFHLEELRPRPAGAQRVQKQLRAMEDGTVVADIGGILYHIAHQESGWSVLKQERAAKQQQALFQRFEDVEKYVFCLDADSVRDSLGLESLWSKWYSEGVQPGTRIDPPLGPGYDVSLYVGGEQAPRGVLEQMDATSFSHAIVLDFDELKDAVTEGLRLPSEAAAPGQAPDPVSAAKITEAQAKHGCYHYLQEMLKQLPGLQFRQLVPGERRSQATGCGTISPLHFWEKWYFEVGYSVYGYSQTAVEADRTFDRIVALWRSWGWFKLERRFPNDPGRDAFADSPDGFGFSLIRSPGGWLSINAQSAPFKKPKEKAVVPMPFAIFADGPRTREDLAHEYPDLDS